jgi:virginiamycin B lyase
MGVLRALIVALALSLVAPAAAGATITEFPLPGPQRNPAGITAGPDGALWFTEQGSGLGAGDARIGRITTAGAVTEFAIPSTFGLTGRIAAGPDGALWYTAILPPRIGRITTTGAVTEFRLPDLGLRPIGITGGPDGAMWFTMEGRIGRITTSGTVRLFALPTSESDAQGDIVTGPDGALWFAEPNANRIGRITTGGTVTEFPVPTPGSAPSGITAGPDGALWFTAPGSNRIGRITTGGTITEFGIPTPDSGPGAITQGPDRALWFTESAGKIGRITTGGTVTDFRLPATPRGVAAGPDGAIWVTEGNNRIGRITTDHPREDAVDGRLFTEPPCAVLEPGCTKPRYGFGASSDPSGARPFGSVSYTVGERAGIRGQDGPVTCLRVEGRHAALGVEFGASFDGTLPARAAIIVVEDNGVVTADRFAVRNLPAGTAPAACPSPAGVALGAAFGVVQGATDPGVVVVDIVPPRPVPTSKRQCKKGGWKAFGFRSKRECIRFVKKHSRPPKP